MISTARQAAIACLSFIAILLLASCGGPKGPETLAANLTDTSIQVSATTLPAGTINFHIANASTSELHEFVIIRTDLNADQLPVAADGNVDEEKLSSPGEKGDIAAGQVGDLTLALPAGRYMFICNQPGHFKAGMHTVFNVTS